MYRLIAVIEIKGDMPVAEVFVEVVEVCSKFKLNHKVNYYCMHRNC